MKLKMAATKSQIMSQGEVESPLQSSEQQMKNHILQSLGRQSSIYSFTLDEFQNSLCKSGKNFGSMNMDEFLNSIWTAKENQAQEHGATNTGQFLQNTINKGILKQPSLPRQGSLTVPKPLCKKIMDEVWFEIYKSQQHNNDGLSHMQNPNTIQRQLTFGEMTLEDFLVRTRVVRAQNFAPAPPQQPSCGMAQKGNHAAAGPSFVARPITAIGRGGINVGAYQMLPQSGVEEALGYPGGM